VRSSRLLIVALVLTTACGQAKVSHPVTPPASTPMPAPKPSVALAGSAARTARAGSARVVMHMRMAGMPGGAITVDAAGVVAFRTRAADLRMRMVAPGSGAVIRMREITRWPVVYMRSPLFAAETHRGKPWVRLDLARLERAQGIDMNALTSTGRSDPTQMLSTLEGESDSIVTVGHETVRGVATTHYRAVIDLGKVAGSANPALRAAVRRAEARLAAMLGKRRMPMDVWIGADGLVRRVAYRMAIPVAATGGTLTTTVSLDMFAFGSPVHVAAPAAAQTTDLTAAVAAAAGSG
jgi:hypothetical protein